MQWAIGALKITRSKRNSEREGFNRWSGLYSGVLAAECEIKTSARAEGREIGGRWIEIAKVNRHACFIYSVLVAWIFLRRADGWDWWKWRIASSAYMIVFVFLVTPSLPYLDSVGSPSVSHCAK